MDATTLRFAAALMHSVPDARLSLTHTNGVSSIVSYEPGAALTPCDWRTLVARNCHDTNSDAGAESYAERVVGFRFERGFDPIGPVARRVGSAGLEFWFASTLHPERLTDIFAQHSCPIDPSLLETGILGDTELQVSVAVVREAAPCSRDHLHSLTESLATEAAVAELLGDGVWVGA